MDASSSADREGVFNRLLARVREVCGPDAELTASNIARAHAAPGASEDFSLFAPGAARDAEIARQRAAAAAAGGGAGAGAAPAPTHAADAARARIAALSVRQLKAELAARGIGTAGLVEKEDLVRALLAAPQESPARGASCNSGGGGGRASQQDAAAARFEHIMKETRKQLSSLDLEGR